MSASSLCVTCGIITQLRASTGPEIRWIRERCTRSTSPNFEKSTDGHGGRSRPNPAGRPQPAPRLGGPRSANLCTSSLVIRPLRPLPRHLVQVDAELARDPAHRRARIDRATAVAGRRRPRSRRPRPRAAGAAAGGEPRLRRVGWHAAPARQPRRPASLGRRSARRRRSTATTSAAWFPGKPCPRSSRSSSPTVPANGAGTSIVALSDSSVSSGSSTATVSPAATRISMTGTSVKSPMSGTSTRVVRVARHTVVGIGASASIS